MKIEPERREAREWLLQFSQVNLDQLRPGDKAKLLVEAEEYLSPHNELLEIIPDSPKGHRHAFIDMLKNVPKDVEIDGKKIPLRPLIPDWVFHLPPQRIQKNTGKTSIGCKRLCRGSYARFTNYTRILRSEYSSPRRGKKCGAGRFYFICSMEPIALLNWLSSLSPITKAIIFA